MLLLPRPRVSKQIKSPVSLQGNLVSLTVFSFWRGPGPLVDLTESTLASLQKPGPPKGCASWPNLQRGQVAENTTQCRWKKSTAPGAIRWQ